MYLKVQYNNSIKNYNLTNEYNKPYIKISNSILPLTTNTTNGIHLNIQANNTTYRPLEYNSMSTSDTYYTSAVNSNGLSSTTALTRSSTYDTQYYTRSSTSSTVYYTRSSTSGTNYLTGSISHQMSCYGEQSMIYTINGGQYYTVTQYVTQSFSITRISGSMTAVSYEAANRNTYTRYSLGLSYTPYPKRTISSTNSAGGSSVTNSRTYDEIVTSWTIQNYEIITRANAQGYPSVATWGFYIPSANTYGVTGSVNQTCSYETVSYSYYTGWDGGWQKTLCTHIYKLDLRTSIVSTTGTQYLTRSSTSATSYLTRSSTYSTVYLTRSSTSGYSGVSSSSSQSSGWL